MSWFTLVEILVVLTIIAIVSSMGLFAYWKHATEARNSARLSSINSIKTWIDNYLIKNKKIFDPSNHIEIKNWNQTISKQGYFGQELANTSDIEGDFLDPLTKAWYLFSITKNATKYSLQYNIEENKIVPKSTWNLAFIVSNEDYRWYNFIAYNDSSVASFDLSSPFSGYSWVYKSTLITESNIWLLENPISSCKTIQTLLPESKTWAYKVNIWWKDYDSKCNFDIENWAWTMIWKWLVTEAAKNSTDFEELAVEWEITFTKILMKSPFWEDYHTETSNIWDFILTKPFREYYYDIVETANWPTPSNLIFDNMLYWYWSDFRVFWMWRNYNNEAWRMYLWSTTWSDVFTMSNNIDRVSLWGFSSWNYYFENNLDNQTRDSLLWLSKRELQTIEIYVE